MVLAAAMGLASCGPNAPKENLQSDIDSLSYTIGITNTQGLMDYASARLGVDSAHISQFVAGIQEGAKDMDGKQKANIAGMQIGHQLSSELFQAINNQLFKGDSLNALNKAKFMEGFLKSLQKKDTTNVAKASEYVRTTADAIQQDTVKVALGKQKIDSLSYMMGISNTTGLMDYATARLGVDSAHVADFIKGIENGSANMNADKTAHLAGLQIGQRLTNEMFGAINNQLFAGDETKSLSKENFMAGFIQGILGTNKIGMDDANTYVRTKADAIQKAAIESKYAEYKKENEEFLATNKTKEGIKTTESGLQYRIIKAGKGAIPTKESRVKVHYKGTLIDGTQFDSSYDRNEPTTFGVNQVIAGWTEALTLMPVGSKWELFIPQDIAYGARDMGTIKPFSTLIFEVELLGIEKNK